MSLIKPFKAIRPKKKLVEQVAAKPYDVLSSAEARIEAEGNPNSFYHITKAEIDFPEGVDDHSEVVYKKAKTNFENFLETGILRPDKYESYYLYRQIMDGRSQTGLVALCNVDDYFNDVIKKHEYTRPEKEKDRMDHMRTTETHPEPIMITYPEVKEINDITHFVINNVLPENDFTTADGIQHTVWIIDDIDSVSKITEIFKNQIPFTYIADGHHRAASTAKLGSELAEKNKNHKGDEDYYWILSVIFPDTQLRIMDYNRLVKDLNGLSAEEFLQKIEDNFVLIDAPSSPYKPASIHHFGLYLDFKWYKLTAKSGTFDENDPVKSLDVSILQENLLDPILGIKDQRTDQRIDFVGGIRGLGELEKRVDSNEMRIAFSLFPVSLKELIAIADSGNVMPPKSTWFEPKLRSGLFLHKF